MQVPQSDKHRHLVTTYISCLVTQSILHMPYVESLGVGLHKGRVTHPQLWGPLPPAQAREPNLWPGLFTHRAGEIISPESQFPYLQIDSW